MLGALREHLRRYGEHAALVGPEWLRGCAAAGSKLAAAGDFLVPLSRLQVTKAQAPVRAEAPLVYCHSHQCSTCA